MPIGVHHVLHPPATLGKGRRAAQGDPAVAAIDHEFRTSYTIDNLSSATWYFAMTAYTSADAESALSNIGSKTIP